MLKFTELPPAPHLASHVQRFLLVEGDFPSGVMWDQMMIPTMTEWFFFNLEDIPQVFTVQGVRVFIKDCSITGQYPFSFHAHLTGKVRLMGVHVRTPGMYQFFHVPLQEFPLHSTTLVELIGPKALSFCQELREAGSISEVTAKLNVFFTELLVGTKTANANLLHSLSLIRSSQGVKSIREIAIETKTSERTLQKLFIKEVGVSPKMYSRLYRLNTAIYRMMMSDVYSWKQIVDDLGYYDQSHFINDFKELTGVLPSQYFVAFPEAHRHLMDF